MKKAFLCMFTLILGVLIMGGTPSTVYAMEEVQTPKLIDSVNNREVSEMNEMLDNVKHFNPEIVSEIEKYSDISIKKLDDNNVQIIISNRIPERIDYFQDGTQEEFYTINSYFGTLNNPTPGNTGISPSDLDVKVRIEAYYSIYEVGPAKIPHYRLISGVGGILNCWENGYRNLVITPKVRGTYENPNGSGGSTGLLTYPRTIACPTIGTLYSKATNNSNYYNSADSYSWVKVDVKVEWRHGENWGNYSNFSLSLFN